jgi:hypothetical protein
MVEERYLNYSCYIFLTILTILTAIVYFWANLIYYYWVVYYCWEIHIYRFLCLMHYTFCIIAIDDNKQE